MADRSAKSICEKRMFPSTPGSCEIRSPLLPGNNKRQVKCQGTDSTCTENIPCEEYWGST